MPIYGRNDGFDYRIINLKLDGKPVENVNTEFTVAKDMKLTYEWQKVWEVLVRGNGETHIVYVDDGAPYTFEQAPEGKRIGSVSILKDGKYVEIDNNSFRITAEADIKYSMIFLGNVTVVSYVRDAEGNNVPEEKYPQTSTMDAGTNIPIDRTEREGLWLSVNVDGKPYEEDSFRVHAGDNTIEYFWTPLNRLTCISGEERNTIYADKDGKVTIPSMKAPAGMETAVIKWGERPCRAGQEIVIDKDTELTWTWYGPFKLGDTGPAGGIIVMVDETKEHGFKYMEIHPDEKGITPYGTAYGYYLISNDRGAYKLSAVANRFIDNTLFGKGKENTENLLDYMTQNHASYDTNTNSDAQMINGNGYAVGHIRIVRKEGYDDWFIPSRDELLAIYESGLITAPKSNPVYWTSSEAVYGLSDTEFWKNAWAVDFSTGVAYQFTRGRWFDSSKRPYVRPVRTF